MFFYLSLPLLSWLLNSMLLCVGLIIAIYYYVSNRKFLLKFIFFHLLASFNYTSLKLLNHSANQEALYRINFSECESQVFN